VGISNLALKGPSLEVFRSFSGLSCKVVLPELLREKGGLVASRIGHEPNSRTIISIYIISADPMPSNLSVNVASLLCTAWRANRINDRNQWIRANEILGTRIWSHIEVA